MNQHIPPDLQNTHPCDDCHNFYVSWFAPSPIWNIVVGGEDQLGDPGGMLCMTCFTLRAYGAGYRPVTWQLSPEWPWRKVDA